MNNVLFVVLTLVAVGATAALVYFITRPPPHPVVPAQAPEGGLMFGGISAHEVIGAVHSLADLGTSVLHQIQADGSDTGVE